MNLSFSCLSLLSASDEKCRPPHPVCALPLFFSCWLLFICLFQHSEFVAIIRIFSPLSTQRGKAENQEKSSGYECGETRTTKDVLEMSPRDGRNSWMPSLPLALHRHPSFKKHRNRNLRKQKDKPLPVDLIHYLIGRHQWRILSNWAYFRAPSF